MATAAAAPKRTIKMVKTTKRTDTPIKKVKAATPPAKTVKPKAEPKEKSVRNTGKTSGLHIGAYQDQLMKTNFKVKLTDEQLAAAMRKEFPNAIAFEVKHVKGIRSAWNNGKRAGQEEAPAKPLPEFDEAGDPVEGRRRRGAADVKVATPGAAKAGRKAKAAKRKAAEIDEVEESEEDVEEEEEEEEEEESDDE